MPPLTYEGQAVYRSFVGPVMGGTFAITSACQDVGELLRWVDRFYTEEIYVMATAGLENVDYVIDGDGTWRLTNAAQSNTYFNGETLIASGTLWPSYATEDFQCRYYDSTVARISQEIAKVNAVAERPFPYYALTAAQAEEIAPLQNAIGRLVDESIAGWVTGDVEISDASFAEFEQKLSDAGLERFMAFWQGVLDGLQEAQP